MAAKKRKELAEDLYGITYKATTEEHNAFMQYQVDKGIIESKEPYKKPGVSCKFCNTPNLQWVKNNNLWSLIDSQGQTHRCLSGDDEPF